MYTRALHSVKSWICADNLNCFIASQNYHHNIDIFYYYVLPTPLQLVLILLPETLAPASRIQHTLSFWDELAGGGGNSGAAAGDRRPKQFDLFYPFLPFSRWQSSPSSGSTSHQCISETEVVHFKITIWHVSNMKAKLNAKLNDKKSDYIWDK